jgi:serine protease
MKNICVLLVIVFFALTSFALAENFKFKSFSDKLLFKGDVEYVPGEVLVKFKEGVSKQKMAELYSAERSSLISSHRGGIKKLRVPAGMTEHEFISRLQRDSRIEVAELNTICRAFMTPNDPLYSPYQWHFPKVNCPAAWDITAGSGVVVGILDSGIAYEDFAIPSYELGTVKAGVTTYLQVPDLAGTAFVPGYDFINDDTHPNDNNGHGTHVAGTVAQTTNNDYGLAGMAFDCTLMPVKVLAYDGYGTALSLIDGLEWATNNGAQVINMSLGWPAGYDPGVLVHNAIKYAYNNGVVLVAGSGNEGVGIVSYPAAYAEVIAVGATRYDDNLSYYSQYGSAQELVAPGGDLNVDQNGDGYGDGVLQQSFDPYDEGPPEILADPTVFGWWFYHGTSQASPHVSALVAMMIANNQTGIENIRTILHETAVDLGTPGWDQTYGYGRIDAYAALTYAQDTIPPAAVTDLAASTGSGNGEVDLTWTAPGDDGNTGQATTYDIRYVPFANGPIDTEAEWNGATEATGEPSPQTAGSTENFKVTGLTPAASYYFALKTADEIPNWSGLSNSPWAEAGETPEVKDYANQDIPVRGTVSGDYQDTWASDNVYESILEDTQPPRRSLLEHKWTFDITGGTTVNFNIEAYHTANTENDHFEFSYSTDDVTYNYILTVTKTSDDNTLQTASLPSSLAGTVYIRVLDTDRTKGNSDLDRVYIDEMFIESTSIPDTIPPTVTVTSPNGGESWYAGTVQKITWNASDNIGITSTDIDYTYDGGTNWYDVADLSGNPGEYDWTVPVTYSSQCLVRVTCFDAASNSGSDESDNYFTILESVEQPMFMESISMRTKTGGPNVTAYAKPKVVEDDTGNPPLEGVTVYGHWYGATSDVDQCITGADGTCEVASNRVKNPSQNFCFQVDSLKKANFYWDDTKGVTYNCISPTGKLAARIPKEFALSQNYPNPFNLETQFTLSLPAESKVSFVIYNVAGQKVKTLVDGYMNAGTHTLIWDGTNEYGNVVSSGIYFYKVVAGDIVTTKKMILMK